MVLKRINPLHRRPVSRGWEWIWFGMATLTLMSAPMVMLLHGWKNIQDFWVFPVMTAFWIGVGLLARRRRIRANQPLVDWKRV